MKVRDVTVSVMIRVLEFSERVVVRRTFYACIVNADFLAGTQIVIDDHASRTDDSHFANFPRLEPTALDGCEAFTREGERHVCHVLYSRRDMSVPLAVNRGGKFIKNMENDRDVMRRQIPRDINVLLEQSQIETPAIDIADLTQISGLNDLGNLLHWRRVEKSVIEHQNQAVAIGDFDQFLALGGRRGHRFFNERMLTCKESCLGQ